MAAADIENLVESILSSFRYEEPDPATAVGTPWPAAKVYSYVERLKQSLVKPYQAQVVLGDTYEQSQAKVKQRAVVWVVVESEAYLEFYDPVTNEFGLASLSSSGELPVTIGVRGDLVGVFCAM